MPSVPLPAVLPRRCLCAIALLAIVGLALANNPAEGRDCSAVSPPPLNRFTDFPVILGYSGGSVLSMAIDGDLAYTGTSWSDWGWAGRTLGIADISGSTGNLLGSLIVPPAVSLTFTLDKGLAYFAPGGGNEADHEFGVADVSDPAAPRFVGSLPWPNAGTCVAVAMDTAYVGDPVGLHAISVTDATSPSPLGSVALVGGALAMAIDGSFAYVGTGTSQLAVVDVLNPASPWVVESLPLPGPALNITVRGSRAYVADGPFGLLVLDVSRPGEPRLLGSVQTPGTAARVVVGGARAYVVDWSSGTTSYGYSLQVVDISNPTHPTIVNSIEILAPDLGPTASVRTVVSVMDLSVSDGRVIAVGMETHDLPPGSDCGGRCFWNTGYAAVKSIAAYEPPAPCVQ